LHTFEDFPYCSCDSYNNSNSFYCILDECDVNKAVNTFVKHHDGDLCCWYCLQDKLLQLIPSYDPFKGRSLPGDVSFFYVRLPNELCDEIESIWEAEFRDDEEDDEEQD
jgi:hypothetical protein